MPEICNDDLALAADNYLLTCFATTLWILKKAWPVNSRRRAGPLKNKPTLDINATCSVFLYGASCFGFLGMRRLWAVCPALSLR